MGILQFDEGEIYIGGESVKEQPLKCKSKIAYIPDNPDIYDYMTGIKYLNFIADIFKVSAADRKERIYKYLKLQKNYATRLLLSKAALDMGWMYFALMGLIAILLGTFGSVFNTFSGLYLAKDNDLLLSMPIPVSVIVASRLISVYIMGLMYSAVVIILYISRHRV